MSMVALDMLVLMGSGDMGSLANWVLVVGNKQRCFFPCLCPNVFAHQEEHIREHSASWAMHELLTEMLL